MALIPPEMIPVSPDQAWEMMETDVLLRQQLIMAELNEQFQPEVNAVYSTRRAGGESYWVSARTALELKQTNVRAERLYQACCDAWEKQGRPKCRAFYKAALYYPLTQLFNTRVAVFNSDISSRHSRLLNLSAHLGQFRRGMDKLRSKWSTKIEIASRDNEYLIAQTKDTLDRQRSATSQISDIGSRAHADSRSFQGETLTNEQIGAVARTLSWTGLATRFRDLQAKPPGQQASADFTWTELDSGSVIQRCTLRGNASSGMEFRNLASIGARKLGYRDSSGADEYWLDCTGRWMQERNLHKDKSLGYCPPGNDSDGRPLQHMFTDQIAGLSATFCEHLMARSTPESALSPPSREKTKSTQKRTPRPVSNGEQRKRKAIFGAIQANLRGPSYCRSLDGKKLRVPLTWQERGCPAGYEDAYRKGEPWKKYIQSEKNRYKCKFDALSSAERSQIIES